MTLNLAREVLEPMHQKKKSKSLLQPEAWWCSWWVSADVTRRYEFTQQEELSHPDTSIVCSVRENEVGISKQ